jgi:hypothetical protein
VPATSGSCKLNGSVRAVCLRVQPLRGSRALLWMRRAEDPALRFGDPRVMALTGALCQTLLAATGFTNSSLRAVIAGLLGSNYRPGQMTYDLRRLRLAGLICRLPRSNRYVLTADGIRIAVFSTKVYNRLLLPLTAADQPKDLPTCAPRWPPSAATSMTTPPAPGCPAPRET